MFTNISWADYLVVITLLLAGYYLMIGIRFYSHELRNLLSGFSMIGLRLLQHKTISIPTSSLSPADFQEKLPEASETVHLPDIPAEGPMAEAERLTRNLIEVMAEAAAQASDKATFIQILQLLLNEYPDLQESSFRTAIQELLISESQKYNSLALSETEVKALWPTDDH